ncbi:MAG: LysE family translocator [Casimicrobiaceae bacterium]
MDAHLIGIHDFALFVAAGLLLNITPGPDTLYIVGRSASQGTRAGAMAALGIGAGCCIHTVGAAAGVSALVLASATAFTAVKLLGALYLVYVGVALLRSGGSTQVPGAPRPPEPLPRIFVQGLLTNALNPKVALFFVAFLPQFVAVDAPHKFIALAVLGVVFNVNGTLWNLFVAWLAARARGGLARRARVAAWVGRITGGLMIVFGVRLAVAVRD